MFDSENAEDLLKSSLLFLMAKCAKCLTPWIRSDDDLDIVYLCFQVRVILGTVTSLDAVVGPHDNFLSVDGI